MTRHNSTHARTVSRWLDQNQHTRTHVYAALSLPHVTRSTSAPPPIPGELRPAPPPAPWTKAVPLRSHPSYPSDLIFMAWCSHMHPISELSTRWQRGLAELPRFPASLGPLLQQVVVLWRCCYFPLVLSCWPHEHCLVAGEFTALGAGKNFLLLSLLLLSAGLRALVCVVKN